MAQTDARGFWLNPKGEPVHKDMIRVNEKIRDETVEKLTSKAIDFSAMLSAFKTRANEEVDSYFALLLQNYGMDEKAKSKKGNLTLENYSGTAKVEIRVHETLEFDEKLQVAKMKVDEYLNDVTKDSPAEIRTLITKAFEVDKKGNIDSKKIFALRAYEITDPRWVEAMSIIDESKKVASSKSYIRFYHRASIDEEYAIVPLDIAAV